MLDKFAELIKDAAEKLDRAKRVNQIATALQKELGDKAEPVLEQLYNQVAG